jgi:excisionase family DNA binding protein
MLVESEEGSTVDLTTAQAAKELGVSRRRVRQYIEDGRLKAKKVGRDYLINSRTLAAFKAQHDALRLL